MTEPAQPPPEEQQPPPPPPVVPPPDADTSSVVPILLTILAAYLAYRAAGHVLKGPWRKAAAALHLTEAASNALENVARRSLNRQRKAAGRSGDELWQYTDEAVDAGVDAGVQTLVDILQGIEPEHAGQPAPDGEKGPTVQNRPTPADIREMAEAVAVSTATAAQNAAAEMAGWDKIWHSQDDGRVRATHAVLDRVRVSAQEPFVTYEGTKIRYPHDPQAPLGEVVNCRCYLKFVRASTRKK